MNRRPALKNAEALSRAGFPERGPRKQKGVVQAYCCCGFVGVAGGLEAAAGVAGGALPLASLGVAR